MVVPCKIFVLPVCRHQFLGCGPGLGIHEFSRLHQERYLEASKSHQDAFGKLDK